MTGRRGGRRHAPPSGGAAPSAGPWTLLLLAAVGGGMTALDGSSASIALPSIARGFHTSVGGSVEWVVIGYLVTIASTQLTFGRLSDVAGRRPVWLAGVALFTLGSGLSGAAPSLAALVGARVVQGVGARSSPRPASPS